MCSFSHYTCVKNKENRIETNCKTLSNKAKAISAELLELNLKNKLEETGKNRKILEETEKLERE